MKMLLRSLILFALTVASCGGAATSPTSPPTLAPATATSAPSPLVTVTATPSALATVAGPPPIFGASECTSATATTRQVLERYFALSTSNNAQAVIDCFAKVWREKNATGVNVNAFTDAAALWSHSGPATNVVVTFADVANGCDRFRVTAVMPAESWWMKGQTGGQGFFSVGPEGGRPRIYETGTAATIPSLATAHCP